ncbi:hypothetical protein B296_00004977 [Ensete ventricosum]|uniref:Uncharacterized protein n=1 Tax=Ensete ventricosum TaxID=4639 RepID=A0A427B8L3_ENSVE|nr:hypothetical protein B296_00004977 [Ensete ventricosum]
MAVLEGLIRSIELWLRLAKKQQPLVDPNLDPVLLVPGIAGSILNAVDDNGKGERVWVRILGADHEFRAKVWSQFDPASGKTISLDEKSRIMVPEDRYGLYAIDCLDPDMIVGRDGLCYYHDMIEQMIKWGYREGTTLFGFGYDFRQSNRSVIQKLLFKQLFSSMLFHSQLTQKLLYKQLVLSVFFCLYSEVLFEHSCENIFEKYVKSWIAIAAPFQVMGIRNHQFQTLSNLFQRSPSIFALMVMEQFLPNQQSLFCMLIQADGLNAAARVGVPADHRGIICDRHVFRILKHWLKAGEPDPFYNPLNDYVILPTAFEMERHTEKSLQVTALKEEWEIISADTDEDNKLADLPPMVGSLSVSCCNNVQLMEKAEATVLVHPQSKGRQHVEVTAVGVTMGAL